MTLFTRHIVLSGAALLVLAGANAASAQTRLDQGFLAVAPAEASAEERSQQTSLWVMEVHFKPMRMLELELTDPKSGEKKKEIVWYLVYRAFNRPLIQRKEDELSPVNQLDPPVTPPTFAPEFLLVTENSAGVKIHPDEVIPEAVAAIRERERAPLLNSVEAVVPLPPAIPADAAEQKPVYGVVTWRGVDPRTDRFTVFAQGFSNGYLKAEGPDGSPLIREKTLVQKFWRPGDEFRQSEREFRFDGAPDWDYR